MKGLVSFLIAAVLCGMGFSNVTHAETTEGVYHVWRIPSDGSDFPRPALHASSAFTKKSQKQMCQLVTHNLNETFREILGGKDIYYCLDDKQHKDALEKMYLMLQYEVIHDKLTK